MAVQQTGKVTGLPNWLAGFKLAEDNMLKGRKRGIIKWGLLVKRRSKMGVPRRLSNLFASAFLVIADGESGPSGSFKGDDASELQDQHSRVLGESQAEAASRTNKNQIVGVIGYSPNYAAIVHELETAGAAGYDPSKDTIITRGPRKGKRRRAEEVHSRVGGYKFLEKPLKGTQREGLAILAKELKIG